MRALVYHRNVGITSMVMAVILLLLHVQGVATALSSLAAVTIGAVGIVASVAWVAGSYLLLRGQSKRLLFLALAVLVGVQLADIAIYPQDTGGLLAFMAILLLCLGWALVAR